MNRIQSSSRNTYNMAKLDGLLQEVIDIVCGSLECNGIVAVRRTGRKLAEKTQNLFNNIFDSIVVTCFEAGLRRLEKLVAKVRCSNNLLSKVKNVTIHILTPHRQKELAESQWS